jgi:hypothetical protein
MIETEIKEVDVMKKEILAVIRKVFGRKPRDPLDKAENSKEPSFRTTKELALQIKNLSIQALKLLQKMLKFNTLEEDFVSSCLPDYHYQIKDRKFYVWQHVNYFVLFLEFSNSCKTICDDSKLKPLYFFENDLFFEGTLFENDGQMSEKRISYFKIAFGESISGQMANIKEIICGSNTGLHSSTYNLLNNDYAKALNISNNNRLSLNKSVMKKVDAKISDDSSNAFNTEHNLYSALNIDDRHLKSLFYIQCLNTKENITATVNTKFNLFRNMVNNSQFTFFVKLKSLILDTSLPIKMHLEENEENSKFPNDLNVTYVKDHSRAFRIVGSQKSKLNLNKKSLAETNEPYANVSQNHLFRKMNYESSACFNNPDLLTMRRNYVIDKATIDRQKSELERKLLEIKGLLVVDYSEKMLNVLCFMIDKDENFSELLKEALGMLMAKFPTKLIQISFIKDLKGPSRQTGTFSQIFKILKRNFFVVSRIIFNEDQIIYKFISKLKKENFFTKKAPVVTRPPSLSSKIRLKSAMQVIKSKNALGPPNTESIATLNLNIEINNPNPKILSAEIDPAKANNLKAHFGSIDGIGDNLQSFKTIKLSQIKSNESGIVLPDTMKNTQTNINYQFSKIISKNLNNLENDIEIREPPFFNYKTEFSFAEIDSHKVKFSALWFLMSAESAYLQISNRKIEESDAVLVDYELLLLVSLAKFDQRISKIKNFTNPVWRMLAERLVYHQKSLRDLKLQTFHTDSFRDDSEITREKLDFINLIIPLFLKVDMKHYSALVNAFHHELACKHSFYTTIQDVKYLRISPGKKLVHLKSRKLDFDLYVIATEQPDTHFYFLEAPRFFKDLESKGVDDFSMKICDFFKDLDYSSASNISYPIYVPVFKCHFLTYLGDDVFDDLEQDLDGFTDRYNDIDLNYPPKKSSFPPKNDHFIQSNYQSKINSAFYEKRRSTQFSVQCDELEDIQSIHDFDESQLIAQNRISGNGWQMRIGSNSKKLDTDNRNLCKKVFVLDLKIDFTGKEAYNGLNYTLAAKHKKIGPCFIFGILHGEIEKLFLHPTLSTLISLDKKRFSNN